jgi:hypothetical protein
MNVHIQQIEIIDSQLVRATNHRVGHLAASVQSTVSIVQDPVPSTTYEIVFLCKLITIEHLNNSSSTRSLKI